MHEDAGGAGSANEPSRVPEAVYHALTIAITSIVIQIVVPRISPPIGVLLGIFGVRRSRNAIAMCDPERSTGRYVAIVSLWTSRGGWLAIIQIVLAVASILSFGLAALGLLGDSGAALATAFGWCDSCHLACGRRTPIGS
jgi:hypothetical protein